MEKLELKTFFFSHQKFLFGIYSKKLVTKKKFKKFLKKFFLKKNLKNFFWKSAIFNLIPFPTKKNIESLLVLAQSLDVFVRIICGIYSSGYRETFLFLKQKKYF